MYCDDEDKFQNELDNLYDKKMSKKFDRCCIGAGFMLGVVMLITMVIAILT